jgi:hypothetical protein
MVAEKEYKKKRELFFNTLKPSRLSKRPQLIQQPNREIGGWQDQDVGKCQSLKS